MMNINNSFVSTFDKANTVEPLTLVILKLASLDETWGNAIRKLSVITVPIDHIIKVVAVPFIEIGEYFRDVYNEEQLGMKVLKGIITPIWLPIRIAVKTAFFALYYFTAGLSLPYQRIEEIFKFKDPKNSYQQSMDKFQKSFEVGSTNIAEPCKSVWEERLMVPYGTVSTIIKSTILQTLDQFCPDPKFEKVYVSVVGRGMSRVIPEIHPYKSVPTYPSIFDIDGPFNGCSSEKTNPNVFVIQIGATRAADMREINESICKSCILSFEQYSKLPYEIPDELLQILNPPSAEPKEVLV